MNKKENKLITEIKKEYNTIKNANKIDKNLFAIKLKGINVISKEIGFDNLSVVIRNIQMDIMRNLK